MSDDNCTICGRKMDVARDSGLCGRCDDKRLVLVKCPVCKRIRQLKQATIRKHPDPRCQSCAQLLRPGRADPIRVCKDCGEGFAVVWGLKTLGRCLACRRAYKKRKRIEQEEKNIVRAVQERVIKINGCTLMKSAKKIRVQGYAIARCRDWFDCPNMESCLDEVAARNWEGFTRIGQTNLSNRREP